MLNNLSRCGHLNVAVPQSDRPFRSEECIHEIFGGSARGFHLVGAEVVLDSCEKWGAVQGKTL